MKFKKEKVEDLMNPGSAVAVYTKEQESPDGVGFTLRADSMGVRMFGPLTFGSDEDLQDFAKALSDAWKDHILFSRAIKSKLII